MGILEAEKLLFGRRDAIRKFADKQNLENIFSSELTELNYKGRPAGRRKIITDENKDFIKNYV